MLCDTYQPLSVGLFSINILHKFKAFSSSWTRKWKPCLNIVSLYWFGQPEKYVLSWIRFVLGPNCVCTICFLYESSWVRFVYGTSGLGYESSWVRVILGTSCLGYESPIISAFVTGILEQIVVYVYGSNRMTCLQTKKQHIFIVPDLKQKAKVQRHD